MSGMPSWPALISAQFPQLDFKFDYPLARLTYFKIGGPVPAVVWVTQVSDLLAVVKYCQQQSIPWRIIGDGSNVIAPDAGLPGLVIIFTGEQLAVTQSEATQAVVSVEAGIKLSTLTNRLAKLGWTGLEPLAGVPGRLGGAIKNNAHFGRALLSDFLRRVQVADSDLAIKWLTKADCQFGYDQSRFQQTPEIILAAEFQLAAIEPTQAKQLIDQAHLYRRQTQPLSFPSSGCIFRNVSNTDDLKHRFPQFADQDLFPVSFIIDQAGLKGTRLGDIEVSDQHAAFLINRGQGTAAQVEQLIKQIKETVAAKFGVSITEEVFWLK